jgi:hypothetical protein
MAVTKGGLYLANWKDVIDTTGLVINLDLTTPKMALHTNSLAPNFDTDAGWTNGSEVTIVDANYATGGKTVTSPSTAVSTGVLSFTSSNFVWTTATIGSAVCGLYYMDALAGNNLVFLTYFGGAFTSTAGTFTVTTPGAGWWTITNP